MINITNFIFRIKANQNFNINCECCKKSNVKVEFTKKPREEAQMLYIIRNKQITIHFMNEKYLWNINGTQSLYASRKSVSFIFRLTLIYSVLLGLNNPK